MRLVPNPGQRAFYCGEYLIQRNHETPFYAVYEVPQGPDVHAFWGWPLFVPRNCRAVVDDFGNLVRIP